MKKFDLLRAGTLTRKHRTKGESDPAENRRKAREFGFDYFDGSRATGYGGYIYDGRWVPVAKRLISRYGLTQKSRILDIGCAKGYLLKDLKGLVPGISVTGIDVSSYALENCHPAVKDHVKLGCASKLEFENKSYDLVLSINTIHNLGSNECDKAISEIVRVTRGNSFIQVDAYRTEYERQLLKKWILTAKTFDTPAGWLKRFKRAKYNGDYYWTIIEKFDK